MVQFQAVPGIITTFVVIAIVLAVTAGTLGSTEQLICAQTPVANISAAGAFLNWQGYGAWNSSANKCLNTSLTGVGSNQVELKSSGQCGNGCAAINSTESGLSANNTLAGWQNTWAVVIAAVVIIGLISYFWVKKMD